MTYENDENDIQDIDDLMNYYRLDTTDLLDLDKTTDEIEEEDFDNEYYEEM